MRSARTNNLPRWPRDARQRWPIEEINGFGDAKAEKFGEAFLAAIREGMEHG